MSEFEPAVEYVIGNETYTKADGTVVSHYEDKETGEISNWGISLKWLKTVNPTATADTVRNLSRDGAISVYRIFWWDKYRLGLIPSQCVATKLFDHCVNMGPATAVELLQKTLNEPLEMADSQVDVDGAIGPQVVGAITNEMAMQGGEHDLLLAFAETLSLHYESIVAKNPSQQKNLKGWLERAEKLPV